jgi:hypothetical protein
MVDVTSRFAASYIYTSPGSPVNTGCHSSQAARARVDAATIRIRFLMA